MNKESALYAVIEKEYPEVDYGKGMYIYDKQGKRYMDCAAGIGVVNIGHGVKDVIDKMTRQAEKISFVYGGTFTSDVRRRLAAKIVSIAPKGMDKVFFCSGGSEAMESLMKIARQYQLEAGRPKEE